MGRPQQNSCRSSLKITSSANYSDFRDNFSSDIKANTFQSLISIRNNGCYLPGEFSTSTRGVIGSLKIGPSQIGPFVSRLVVETLKTGITLYAPIACSLAELVSGDIRHRCEARHLTSNKNRAYCQVCKLCMYTRTHVCVYVCLYACMREGKGSREEGGRETSGRREGGKLF